MKLSWHPVCSRSWRCTCVSSLYCKVGLEYEEQILFHQPVEKRLEIVCVDFSKPSLPVWHLIFHLYKMTDKEQENFPLVTFFCFAFIWELCVVYRCTRWRCRVALIWDSDLPGKSKGVIFKPQIRFKNKSVWKTKKTFLAAHRKQNLVI